MESNKDNFLTKLGLVEYWKEHIGVKYAKCDTVYSKINAVTKTIYGVFLNEKADEMLTFIALFNNNYEILPADVKANASREEVLAHVAKYGSETNVY